MDTKNQTLEPTAWEQLQEQSAIALKGMLEDFATGKDFVVEQIPPTIQQLLIWEFVAHLVPFLIFAVFVPLFLICFNMKMLKKYSFSTEDDNGIMNSRNTDDGPKIIFWVGNIVPLICMLFALVGGAFNLTWLKIWLAPNVYLIEYAANLIK